jgi:hypothetical protein
MRILRGIGSRSLPCGCLVGLYETYSGHVVALIDARGSTCIDQAHRVDARCDRALADGEMTAPIAGHAPTQPKPTT